MTDTQQIGAETTAVTEEARAAIDWAAFAEMGRAHEAAAEAVRPYNKARLFDALASSGVTNVLVTFDGYGDSGQIESVDAYAGDKPVELPDHEITLATLGWRATEPTDSTLILADAIEHLAYDCLATTHLGWENNDGAYGTFEFDVAERTIELEHDERFTDVQTFVHEL